MTRPLAIILTLAVPLITVALLHVAHRDVHCREGMVLR